jgi:type II secretory pathway component PulF
VLKVKTQLREQGRRVFVYEQPSTGDIFTITDPDLQLSQLDQVQREVADLLANGLPLDGGTHRGTI